MSNKLKLTSESGLTQRPTSRIDTSYRGNSQQQPKRKLWIKFKQVNNEITDEKPYFAMEKQRKVNSCHIRYNRKSSSEMRNQLDFNEIKQYIKEVDSNYNDDQKFGQQQQNLDSYQNDKRINHLNLLIGSYRDNIKNKNKLKYLFDEYKNSTTKLKLEPNSLQQSSNKKQYPFNRYQSDKQIGQKIQELRYLNSRNTSTLYHNYFKEFKACSDQIVYNEENTKSQQFTKLQTKFGDLDNFGDLTQRVQSERKNLKYDQQKRARSIHRFQTRQNKDPELVDNQIELDESMISQTEAKLNQLYGESVQQQKNILSQGNPMKMINSIKKMDQIKQMIDNVNAQKLMNKFII